MNTPSHKGWMTLVLALGLAAGAGASGGGDLLVTGSLDTKSISQPHPGMTSEFHSLVEQLRNTGAADRAKFQKSAPPSGSVSAFELRGENGDEIETYVCLNHWTPGAREAVEALGVEVVGEDESRYILQAWVPLDVVEDLAALPAVRELRRPSYGLAAMGSVITQGDANLNTNFVRQLGNVNGNGLRVGVISRGLWNEFTFPVDTVASAGTNRDVRVLLGDIPPDPTSEDGSTSGRFGAVRIFPPSFSQHVVWGDQMPDGAAVLETLYDIAPGAEYYYARARTSVEMETARNWLLGQDVDVIVDTMVFYDAGRFDGSSTVSRRAQQIMLNENVVYITATGNQSIYGSDRAFPSSPQFFPLFVNGHFSPNPDSKVGKFHNFASGRTTGKRVEGLIIEPLNGVIDVALVWDDVWDDRNPRAADDLDLYLVHPQTLDISTPFASSRDRQDGFGKPYERITLFDMAGSGVSAAGGQAAIVINRADQDNDAPTMFTLVIRQGFVPTPYADQYLTHGVAGNNGDALAPVLTTGGIDAREGVNAVFPSSVPGVNPGPGRALNNDFVRWYSTQQGPAVMSYTNTYAVSAGGPPPLSFEPTGPFPGTSAAAAHMGGLVTLLRHSYPEIPAWMYYDLLRDTSPPPAGDFPTASPIQVDKLAQFKNAPQYLRVNGFDAWMNIREALAEGDIGKSAFVSTVEGAIEWTQSGSEVGFDPPVFGKSGEAITLSPGGKRNVFGFVETPVLQFPDGKGGMKEELDPDAVYLLKVRVGSDQADPKRVPHFRLRLMSGGSDQAVMKVVAGVQASAGNPPATVAGREYYLFYRPSNEEIAKQGVRFAFDLIDFMDDTDSDATLYLHEISLRKVDVRY